MGCSNRHQLKEDIRRDLEELEVEWNGQHDDTGPSRRRIKRFVWKCLSRSIPVFTKIVSRRSTRACFSYHKTFEEVCDAVKVFARVRPTSVVAGKGFARGAHARHLEDEANIEALSRSMYVRCASCGLYRRR